MTQQDTTPQSRVPASFRVIWQAFKIWYDDWFNLFVQNFLVTISWMTIILGPPMLFGLYEIGHELAHGRSHGASELLMAAKRHIWVSWLWALINIVVVGVIAVNIVFYWQLGHSWAILLVSFFLFLGIFWATIQIYVIPFYMAQEHKSLKIAFKNAALTFLAAPGYSLILFFYTLILLGSSFMLLLPLILAAPALAIVTGNYAVRERLQAFGIASAEE